MELVGGSDSGVGVTGTSNSGVGVVGTSNIRNGVIGKGSNGVVGTGGNIGVVGDSTSGYGGAFSGGLAPLRLEPSKSQGSPTSGTHSVGELYVDNNGALYFCVASGTPGTWKRVQLV